MGSITVFLVGVIVGAAATAIITTSTGREAAKATLAYAGAKGKELTNKYTEYMNQKSNRFE